MQVEGDIDAELLAAWREGDARAGNELFERHVGSVLRFFDNKVRRGSEDLTQTTFLRLVEGRERIREGRAVRAYILGIARNVLRAHLRERRSFDPEVDSMTDVDPGPTTLMAEVQEQRILLEALRRLPLADQTLLELRYWERMGSEEMGRVVGSPASTVRWRVGRARKRLEAQLARLADSPEHLASTLNGLDDWARAIRARLGPCPAPSGSGPGS